MTVIAAIQSSLKNTKTQSMRRMMESDRLSWDNRKKRALGANDQAMGGRLNLEDESISPSIYRSSDQQVHIQETIQGRKRDENQVHSSSVFANLVREALKRRSGLSQRKLKLATLFRDCVSSKGTGTLQRRRLENIYTAMSFVCREQQSVTKNNSSSFTLPGALSYLGWQMRRKMKADIAANPIDAARGGVPGMIGDVRSWLSIVFVRGLPSEIEMYRGVPLWAMIWYCTRVCDFDAALQVVEEALSAACESHHEETKSSLQSFRMCLESFCNGRNVAEDIQERLVQAYISGAARDTDPYWRACLIIMAGGESDRMRLSEDDYALLFSVIEDYLFLRLASTSIRANGKAEGLREVQDEIQRFGPGHFDRDGEESAFYSLILILVGRVDAAVEYLEVAGDLETALNVALIDQYHNNGDYESSVDVSYYGKLVWSYISRIIPNRTADAILYIQTIRHRGTRESLLIKLILRSRDFDRIVGSSPAFSKSPSSKLYPTTTRRQTGLLQTMIPFSFDNFTDLSLPSGTLEAAPSGEDGPRMSGSGKTEWKEVVSAAAREAEANGDQEAALRCYEAAEEAENVLRVLTSAVLAEMTSQKASENKRSILHYARAFLSNCNLDASAKYRVRERIELENLRKATLVSDFFDAVNEENFRKGWEALQQTSLMPTHENDLLVKVSELRGGPFEDRMDEIIIAAARCLIELLKQAGTGGSIPGIESIEQTVRLLVDYGGMIGTSSEVAAKLVKLEAIRT